MANRGKRHGRNLPAPNPRPPQNAAQVQVIAQSYSGPLPHPDILRQYEEILPGSADRIITMAEKQTDHRIGLESFNVHSDANRANIGVLAALIVFLAFDGSSVYLISEGHSTAGMSIGLGSLASMVSAFVFGTISRRKEREGRMQRLVGPQPGRQR